MARLTERLSAARAAIFDGALFAAERLVRQVPPEAVSAPSEWVLPPYPGEMGHEIRGFLGRVEPYLRRGWKILARRPAFSPPGAAICDEAFFPREARLFR